MLIVHFVFLFTPEIPSLGGSLLIYVGLGRLLIRVLNFSDYCFFVIDLRLRCQLSTLVRDTVWVVHMNAALTYYFAND